MATPRPAAVDLVFAALATLGAVNVVPRLGHFSGDAMIHLAVAERAARGAWFEFNPGEVTSATTAPAWTLLDAALLRLGGFPLALSALPVVSLAMLVVAALLVRATALRLGAATPAALIGALLFASLPGVASNAPLGMENTAFAAVALGFVLAVAAPGRLGRVAPSVALGALLGLGVLLRPEGVALVAPALVAMRAARPTDRRGGFALLLVACAVVAPVAYAHWRITGRWLPASGLARVMAARRDPAAVHLAGPLWLYLAVPARLVIQLPLVLLALDGARAPQAPPALRRALVATFVVGLAGYTLVTGAAHVARLTQWLWAMLAPLAALGLSRQLERVRVGDRRRGRLLVAALAAHLAVAVAETIVRGRSGSQGRGGPSRAALLRGIDQRRASTDRLLRALCRRGCCPTVGPPSVALVEVQRRLTLDGRVAVASLDGVTAPSRGGVAVNFDPATGCPRLDAVLAHSAVLAVLEDPRRQLAGCVTPAVARALVDPATSAPPLSTGWTWDAALHGWSRPCVHADQPPVRAAWSIVSASPTVASRTAPRPLSP